MPQPEKRQSTRFLVPTTQTNSGPLQSSNGLMPPRKRRRLHRRWVILLAAGLLVALVSVTVVLWPADCPIRIEWVNTQASGMLDDWGNEAGLVTMRVSNLGPSRVHVDPALPTEVRIETTWVELDDNWRSCVGPGMRAILAPGTAREVLFVLPADAEACRVWLDYDPLSRREYPLSELVKQRIVKHLGTSLRTRVATTPWLAKLIWLDPFNRLRHSPNWQEHTSEVTLPR